MLRGGSLWRPVSLNSCTLSRRAVQVLRQVSGSVPLCHERLYEVLPPLESFSRRHIGPSPESIKEMLDVCKVKVNYILIE